jgi:hypothetical protein
MKMVQDKLVIAAEGKPIISVSQKPIEFGLNICVGDIGRSHLSMYKQMWAGGKEASTEFISLAEHDCLYTPEHFNWIPPEPDVFYYNVNHWFVQANGSRTGEYSYMRRRVLSMLICGRDIFLKAVSEKVWMLEHGWMIKKGVAGACEPGVLPSEESMVPILQAEFGIKENSLDYQSTLAQFKDLGKELGRWKAEAFRTTLPNLDIRHGGNFSGGRRARENRYDLPYWGRFEGCQNLAS